MTLTNGKFYVDGKEVPVEIGNKEQIELIKKAEYMREHGVDIAVDVEEKKCYTIRANYICPSCNKRNYLQDGGFEDNEPDEDDIERFLDYNPSCKHCGQDFELGVTDGGDYKFKL